MLLLALLAVAIWIDSRVQRHGQSSPPWPTDGGLAPEAYEYLSRVDAGLDLPVRNRNEIRSELLAHLIDSTAAIEAEGLDPERACREALARLGSAGELARAMNQAHRSTRRLLAGAAGGVFEAGVGAVMGMLFGWLMALLLLVAATVMLATVLRPVVNLAAGFLPAFDTDQNVVGTNTALVAGVLAFAAWMAARRAVRTSHRLSRWSIGTVGRWWAVSGGGALAFLILFVVRAQQTWLTVPFELLIPVAFAFGALFKAHKTFSYPIPRPVLVVGVIAVFVAPVLVLMAGTSVSGGGYSYTYDYTSIERAWDRVAPAWGEDAYPGLAHVDSGVSMGSPTFDVTFVVDEPDTVATFHELRFEAWRAAHYAGAPVVAQEAMVPDSAFATPYTMEAAVVQDGRIVLHLDLGRVRTTSWLVFLTGVAPDGQRYRLAWPQFYVSTFNGTVWEWLTAGS
jgi:uncharacterized membrane protein